MAAFEAEYGDRETGAKRPRTEEIVTIVPPSSEEQRSGRTADSVLKHPWMFVRIVVSIEDRSAMVSPSEQSERGLIGAAALLMRTVGLPN